MLRRTLITVAVSAVWLGLPSQVLAQNDDAAFFEGRTITYIVATSAGGGYDTYGRLLVRHMEKYLPGTRIIVRNVPGAGNIIGANTIYASRPDGLTFGIFNTGLIYSQMLGMEGVRFDLGQMSWIGKMAAEGRSLVLSTNSGLDSVEDLIDADEPVLLASSGIGSGSHIETRILQETLGLNVRIIPNILGGDTELYMMRGEVAGVLNAASVMTDFVGRGAGRYVLSIAGERSGLDRVPQAREFVTDARHLRLLTLVEMVAELGRMTAGPPGIPPARLEVLRNAYMRAANDPELLAQAAVLEIPIQPARGDRVAEIMKTVLDQPPDVIELLARAAQAR